jgi:gluconolactonase
VIPLEVPDIENKDGNVTRRTLLKGAAALAATGATVKAASAATERPLGETGVPLGDTQPLPLGPLPGSRYPDPHIEALGKRFKGSPGTGSVEHLATVFRWVENRLYICGSTSLYPVYTSAQGAMKP